MANFKICLRTQKSDGLFPVYIRVTHKRQVGYIKTDKCVSKEGFKKGEIVDPVVLLSSFTIILPGVRFPARRISISPRS